MRNYLLLACVILVSCVTVRHIDINSVEPSDDSAETITVETPVKAHLTDGATVMFPKGVTVGDNKVRGQGLRYDITLTTSEPVTEIDLETVAAMESYQDVVNTGATVAASTVTTVAGGYAAIGLLKIMFGSCPTTYSLEAGEPILEAESFSYSIAPGFEARDIDRLGIRSTGQEVISLEMRNEALETHYINHVELLEVMHSENEFVYPDARGRPVVVAAPAISRSIVDQEANQITGIFDAADGIAWSTTAERLQRVSAEDMHDHLYLEFDAPASGKTPALVLRLRNSLLNTVLLYEVMLRGQGFRALDWMASDLDRLGPKYALATWYQKNMGMDIAIWDRGRYRSVTTLADTGPIAWNEIAIPLPQLGGDKVRVRLSFIADNWRIDQVTLASVVAKPRARRIPLEEARSGNGEMLADVPSSLRAADENYVVTRPGESMVLNFHVGAPQEATQRTWFLAAEGYYIEWMRKDWLTTTNAQPFVPNDEAILAALELWEPRREDFRRQFEATRINVR